MNTNKISDKVSMIQNAVISTINKLQYHLAKTETSTEYIHRIRVDIKHLRGWLRLLRINSENFNWRIIDQHLAAIAKSLSGVRDFQVINDTLESLKNNAETHEQRTAITCFQEHSHIYLTPSLIDWKIIKKQLLSELDTIKNEFIHFKTMASIKSGLSYTYKKLIKHGKKAYSNESAYDELHKLRKWIKYLNYQLGYISKAYSSYNKFTRQLDKLGDNLGNMHDLILLKDILMQTQFKEGNGEELKILNNLIETNYMQMFKKTKKSYVSLFNLPPKKFTNKI
jgi:CHAD domain-containing protein